MSAKQGDLFGGGPLKPREAQPAQRAQPAEPKPVVEPAPAPPPAKPPEPLPAWRRMAPAPASAAAPSVLTVSQLTRQVKDALEPRFTRVLVRGEISNFRGVNARGHLYFALTDARSSIDVKLWATTAAKLKFQLKDGLSVIIEGNLDVYEPQGRYSLIVEKLEPEGLGAQALRFEQLKQKLVAEGLIGDRRTRPRRELPFLPRRVGVVTSISGAALRDFLKVLHRRHPGIPVLVADARVQGDGAVFELRRALRWLSRSDVDVIVVTRGGGSADDLWTFNEEPVVRALWACTVPIVSAVGHEIDVTLSDLVADVRAPTPSAAAELIAPSLVDLRATLATLKSRAHRAMEKAMLRQRALLVEARRRLGDPRRELASQRLVLSNGADRMRSVLSRLSRLERARLAQLRSGLGDPRHAVARTRPALSLAGQRLREALRRRLRTETTALAELKARLRDPRRVLAERRLALRELKGALETALARRSRRRRDELTALGARLTDPRHALAAERARLAALKTRLRDQNPREQLLRRRERLRELRHRASAYARQRLAAERRELDALRAALRRRDPRPELAAGRSRLVALRRELERFTTRLSAERQQLDVLRAQLEALNPLEVLERGFALARAHDRVIRRAAELAPGEQFELRFADGSITVRVVDDEPKS